jgi:hypothetical protein
MEDILFFMDAVPFTDRRGLLSGGAGASASVVGDSWKNSFWDRPSVEAATLRFSPEVFLRHQLISFIRPGFPLF